MAKKKTTGRVHQKPRRKIIRQRRTKKQIAYDKQYETKTYKRSDDLRRDIKMINERLKSLVKRLGPKSHIVQKANTSIDTVIPEQLYRWGSNDEIQIANPKKVYEDTDLHEVIKALTKSIPTYQDIKEEYQQEYNDLMDWDPKAMEGIDMEDFIEIQESLEDALGAIYDRIKRGTADDLDEAAISVMKAKDEYRYVNYQTLQDVIKIGMR